VGPEFEARVLLATFALQLTSVLLTAAGLVQVAVRLRVRRLPTLVLVAVLLFVVVLVQVAVPVQLHRGSLGPFLTVSRTSSLVLPTRAQKACSPTAATCSQSHQGTRAHRLN
jgi:hypothetical protein